MRPDGAGYDSFAFISSDKHGGELAQTAGKMKDALDTWVKHAGLPPVAAADKPNGTDFCRCDTLAGAVSFLYTALQFPETILA